CRRGDLGRDSAPRRDAHGEGDRRDQQGQGRADLQAGRLRRGRRPLRHRAAADRGDPQSPRRALSGPRVAETLPDLSADVERVARAALEEDGPRDLTTLVTVPRTTLGSAAVELREPGVVAGLRYAEALARLAGLGYTWGGCAGNGCAVTR